MYSFRFLSMFVVLLMLHHLPVSAQFDSGAQELTEPKLIDREWHLTSKKSGNDLLGESGGDLRTVGNTISSNSTFVIVDGPNDEKWWTADVRWFHMRSLSSGLYVTVQGTQPGSDVGLEPLVDGSGESLYKQQFRLIATAQPGWYKLRSRLSQNGADLVLEIAGNGQLIVGDPDPDPAPEQKFAFNLAMPADGGARYALISNTISHFLSDNGIATIGTEAVHIKNSNESVVWNLQPAGSGYYRLFNELSQHYLTVPDGNSNGDHITMTTITDDHSLWSLVRDGHLFRIKSKYNDLYVGVNNHPKSGQPLYLVAGTAGAGGIGWAVHRVNDEFIPAGGNYTRIESGTANPLCVTYGPDFMKALAERVGLSPNLAYFPFITSAIAEKYGSDRLEEILKKIDLNNPGHRVDLALMVRRYVTETLAFKPRNTWTPIEEQAVAEFEQKIKNTRIDYANRVVTAWHDYENDYANSGSWGVSDLLDNITADGFEWPSLYVSNNVQDALMLDYMQASISFDERNLMIIGGTFTGLSTGYAFANVAISVGLHAVLTEAVLGESVTTVYAAVAGTGPVITVALVAAATLAMKSMEVAALQELLDDIDENTLWANQPVSINNTMQSPDLLAMIRLTNDLDYVIGAPATSSFQYNTNDNQYQPPFYLQCANNVTVELDANSQGTLNYFQITGGIAIPACGDAISYGLSKSQFNCADIGNHVVTLTAENDIYSAECSTTVIVKDNLAPVVQCKNATIYLDAGGTAAAGYDAIYQGGVDNCGVVTAQSISQTVFGCSHLGANTVTLTAQDEHGNSATCQSTVTVVDNLPPMVVCRNSTVYLDANGTGNVTTSDVFQSGADNCGMVNQVSVAPSAFNCSQLGANTTTLLVNDGHGNSKTCAATVTVVDNLAPAVVCKNKTVFLNTNGVANIITNDVFQSGVDNCGTVNMVSVSPNTFNCSNLGANNAVLTVNDGHGNANTCTAVITVEERIAPTMLCRPVTLQLNASGQATLTESLVNNGSYDNCTITQYSLSRTLFTCADLGINTVSLEGIDQSSNRSFCNATVTVLDQIKPVAKCKNMTANLGASGAVSLAPAQVDNGSTDNCSFSLSLTPNSFTCAQVGNNTVSLRATDASGNTSTCSAVVLVKDLNAPIALCKNPVIYLNNTGQASISASDVDNGSTDACGIVSRTINRNQFACSDLGAPVAVTLTLKDVNNNISTCLSNVTIKDNTAPSAVCENTSVHLGANGSVTVYPSQLADNSYDNCSVWSYSPTAKVYTTAHIGQNNLTITVKDWSGNGATCVSVVQVLPYNGGNNFSQNGSSKVQEADAFDLKLFPNPTANDANMAFELPADQWFVVQVFDLSGRLVFNREGQGLKGKNEQLLTLGSIAPGMYVVQVQSEGIKAQKRLVIQE